MRLHLVQSLKWHEKKDIKAVLKTFDAKQVYVRTEMSLIVLTLSGVAQSIRMDLTLLWGCVAELFTKL